MSRDCYTMTMPDMTGQVATGGDMDYTLSLNDVSERYVHAGHPRTLRTLQRYCASGHLDARKIATAMGDKYLVTPESVTRHLAQIQELSELNAVTARRDASRPVAMSVATEVSDAQKDGPVATGGDTERQMPTGEGEMSRYVALMERQLEQASDERDFLHEQINRKDKTIEALIERDRETNFLVRGLQEMLTPLLGPRRDTRDRDVRDAA